LHLLAAWKYGIMLEPELLTYQPAARVRGYTANRTGYWAEIIHFHSPGVPVALARIPHDRLMAGTDWVGRPGPAFVPYGIVYGVQSAEENPYPPTVPSLVDFLAAAGASQETVQAIAFGNATRMLKLDVRG
jgi:hypothetical protein